MAPDTARAVFVTVTFTFYLLRLPLLLNLAPSEAAPQQCFDSFTAHGGQGGRGPCLQASSRGLGLRVGGEGADTEAGGAAGLFVPHRSGDVEVRPRRVADEFLEKERGGDRAWGW